MASHRIGARVAGLSPEQLCAIIEAQAGVSDAALRVADEHATRLVEQPEWVLSEVLLSPDLAPHILAHLPIKEHAAKGTCRAWRRGWKETLVKRERPRLLVIGGYGTTIVGDNFLSSMERYDPSINVWEEEAVAPLPTARRLVGTTMLDGNLYAVGGCAAVGGDHLSSVERYDLAANAWEAVAPMSTTRSLCGVAVLNGKLYAVGGEISYDDDGVTCSVERYDPATNAWEAVAPMAAVRMGFGVAVLDGKLYAIGGGDEASSELESVERYDPATDVWEAVAPMAAARMEHAVAVLDGKLYAVGGYGAGGGRLSSVERFDPALNVWEAVAPMAIQRARLVLAVLEGKLYAVGGCAGQLSACSSVERYNPATNVWEAVAPMSMARISPGLASI